MFKLEIPEQIGNTERTSHTPVAADVDLDPSKFSDIRVDSAVTALEDQLIVVLNCSASAHLICDRTLEPFVEEIEGEFGVVYKNDLGDEPESEELKLLPSDARQIVLTEAVRDTLVLAIPARKIAPAAREIEIPTEFGVSETKEMDPRWEALKALKKDGSE